jgi:hypothetical protein
MSLLDRSLFDTRNDNVFAGSNGPSGGRVQLGQVAIYCRVSSEDQSCERQERDLRAFARPGRLPFHRPSFCSRATSRQETSSRSLRVQTMSDFEGKADILAVVSPRQFLLGNMSETGTRILHPDDPPSPRTESLEIRSDRALNRCPVLARPPQGPCVPGDRQGTSWLSGVPSAPTSPHRRASQS